MKNPLSSYETPYEYYGDDRPKKKIKKAEEVPQKKAVALMYDPDDQAPQVIASGKGQLAEKIIAKAKENDVPTYVDQGLADTLLKLEIGDYIPPELYGVVAEILVFVDRMDKIKDKVKR